LIINIPGNLFKWPLRIVRGKYKPESFSELLEKIFKVRTRSNELCRKMHVNVMTRGILKKLLRGYRVTSWCEDFSRNPLSLATSRWWGMEIMLVATKE
jgi:hypothetical protein